MLAMMIIRNLERLLLYMLNENKSFTNNNSAILKNGKIRMMNVKIFNNFLSASCKIFVKIAAMIQKSSIVKML
jgi:hypothetical protein